MARIDSCYHHSLGLGLAAPDRIQAVSGTLSGYAAQPGVEEHFCYIESVTAANATAPRQNIFVELAEYMTQLESSTSGVRQVVEVGLASAFLQVFMGTDWRSRHIRPVAAPDKWIENRLQSDATNTSWITHFDRTVKLANAFFTLLHSEAVGLEFLRRRFHTRPTKPCFIEAQIASLQVANGFRVEIVGESGLRGRDFDLTARRDGMALNIEVTGKDEIPLSAKTIRNTLTSKRTQLPTTVPAIVYMHVPANWMQDKKAAQAIFSEAFNDVFSRSRRFSAVVLVWEYVMATPDGGTSSVEVWPCYNNNARHPLDLDLLDLPLDADGRPKFANSIYDFLKEVQARPAKS
jgi:hypothetical protein